MGLKLEFYMGDPAVIGRAVAQRDWRFIYRSAAIKAHADFSLHLQPKDLDTLSREAAKLMHYEPLLLRHSLSEAIGGDGREHGAFLVSNDWVFQIADLNPSVAAELAKRWIETMAQTYKDENIRATPAAELAVAELICLCRRARETSTPVIHAWSL